MAINGYYVCGRYTSVAWFLCLYEAEEYTRKMSYYGIHYTVVAA